MPTRQLRLAPSAPDDVTSALATLRAEIGLPAMFPQEVLEEARAAAAQDFSVGRADRRDIEFVTIDPPGSKDLDQAVHVAQSGEGYVVHYAIADVGAFVVPGGALEAEVRRRGVTVYGPDARTPLHPKILSEGAASLLPGEDRPAVLWTVTLDARGIITGAHLERALVRSRERLTYAEVQSGLDAGTASESLQLLADVGRLRQSLEVARGGVSLEVPEQEVERRDDGTYALSFRRTLPVEEWNAQISLLTGIAAAHLMREAGVGLLRTLPEADPRDVARLRRTARALGIEWPDTLPYARLVPTLVSRVPEHAAFLNEATTLFRGAGYVAFGMPGPDGGVVPPPENTRHAAIAADYAHVTAPLRRLVDRYATEICLAVVAGTPVPAWVLEAMPDLPGVMAETGRRAASFERACIDIVEASLLGDRVGEEFDAVVVDVEEDEDGRDPQRGQVVLRDPAVRARVSGSRLPLGEAVRVRLTEADVAGRRVRFTMPGTSPRGGEAPGAGGAPEGRGTPSRRDGAPGRRAATPSPAPGPSPTPPAREPRASVAPAFGSVAAGPSGRMPSADGVPRPAPEGDGPRPLPADGRYRTSSESTGYRSLSDDGGYRSVSEAAASRSSAGHGGSLPPSYLPPSYAPARPTPGLAAEPTAHAAPEPAAPQVPPAAAVRALPEPAAPAPSRRSRNAAHPPAHRPVRPQVRDEVPMSEPWPRHAPVPRRLAPMSEPVPAVGDGYGAGHAADHQGLASRELPVVVAADLLAVEGARTEGYRY
ncbi:MAG TPA: RNB domain-containing ribonuclease [Promicromonospora sp.]|nr:RNB domain-containing ribonuclease [Promicromonospora sp.]